MKTHGDAGWESFPSYLDIVVPRALDFLRQRDLTITFFVVGQDAALSKNGDALRAITAAGHEVGNHSFHHEPWLHTRSEAQIAAELGAAEDAIIAAAGQRPIGFRGPGYSCSPAILRNLAERGYLYDASTLPTFLGPLARAYYFMTARLSAAEAERRKQLFGKLADGLRPIRPYRWQLTGNRQILELPVTTMPVFRVPFHLSYVLYLSGFSTALALLYFRIALALCRLTGTPPAVLLHPLDFLDGADAPALAFFPAMQLGSEQKLAVVSQALALLARNFEIAPMGRYARRVAERTLPTRAAQ
jgi:hypothetical protein